MAGYVDVDPESPSFWAGDGAGEAEAAVEAVHRICRDVCPVVNACVGRRCNYYRIEHAASEALSGGEEYSSNYA